MANLTVRDMTREKYKGRIRDRDTMLSGERYLEVCELYLLHLTTWHADSYRYIYGNHVLLDSETTRKEDDEVWNWERRMSSKSRALLHKTMAWVTAYLLS